jgi:hypothetical protein
MCTGSTLYILLLTLWNRGLGNWLGAGMTGEMGCVIAWHQRKKSGSEEGTQTNRRGQNGAIEESYHATGIDRKQGGGEMRQFCALRTVFDERSTANTSFSRDTSFFRQFLLFRKKSRSVAPTQSAS